MHLGLAGKVAIVTGGSTGIGFATARLFLEEGARVAILARTPERLRCAAERLREQTGGELHAAPVDVLDREAVERFVARVADRFGGIDCLVNNAGASQIGTVSDTSDEAWRVEIELKFFGMLNPTRAVRPYMRHRGGGRIVNVNAILARQPEPHMVATSAARAGVLNLSRSLAAELAADNILVNTVALGLIESDQWERRLEGEASTEDRGAYFHRVARERHVPLGRFGTPEEVAGPIVFLCSRYASYVSGAVLEIGGGIHRYV